MTYPRRNKPPRTATRRQLVADCTMRREFDERVCTVCGLRFSIDEDQPDCPKWNRS